MMMETNHSAGVVRYDEKCLDAPLLDERAAKVSVAGFHLVLVAEPFQRILSDVHAPATHEHTTSVNNMTSV